MVEERGLTGQFVIDSCGTGSWHIGKPPDSRMMAELTKAGISTNHRARQFSQKDFDNFDLILVADESNKRSVLAKASPEQRSKVKSMCNYLRSFKEKEVPDPYYENNFPYVLEMMRDMSAGLLNELTK